MLGIDMANALLSRPQSQGGWFNSARLIRKRFIGGTTLLGWLGVLAGALLSPTQAVAAEVTGKDVELAIDRAVQFLKRQQNDDGTWAEFTGYESGTTALCTLALLSAGVEPTDPKVARSLEYLRNAPLDRTYSVALQTMALCVVKQKSDIGLIRERVRWLERAQRPTGMWGYDRDHDGPADNSNSQFALLALHEAEKFSQQVQVDRKVWKRAQDHWIQTQKRGQQLGAWGYRPHRFDIPTASMTCAGISSVYICTKRLADRKFDPQNPCCGGDPSVDALERGLDWLGRNWSIRENRGQKGAWFLYYMYGLERACRLTARRFIQTPGGPVDWYRAGAAELIHGGHAQDFEGAWSSRREGESGRNIGTALALLFLAKGRRPLLMGKIMRADSDWNQHPDDAANLTEYVGNNWEVELTWQVLDVEAASLEDLEQLPVLYFSGKKALSFKNPQAVARKLALYVNRGGFILAVANCQQNSAFVDSFRELVQSMYKKEGFQLQPLVPNHPIWRVEKIIPAQFVKEGNLEGVNVACRTSIVLSKVDLSCRWQYETPWWRRQLKTYGAKTKPFLAEMELHHNVGLNVLAYATNRELKYKYESFDQQGGELSVDNVDRGKINIALVEHGGDSKAAAGALPNLKRALQKAGLTRVNLNRSKELRLSDADLFDYPLVFMHGRTSFRLDQQSQEQLKLYCSAGGVLVADAVCGSQDFVLAFRREIEKTFGAKLETIPPEHPIFTSAYGGTDIQSVRRREPQEIGAEKRLQLVERKVPPTLEGLKVGDRYVVLFSPYDISCALENHASVECRGYVTEDALRIGLNLVLYALGQPGP